MSALPPEVLDLPVVGRHLPGPTLRAVLDAQPATVLAFLRHLG